MLSFSYHSFNCHFLSKRPIRGLKTEWSPPPPNLVVPFPDSSAALLALLPVPALGLLRLLFSLPRKLFWIDLWPRSLALWRSLLKCHPSCSYCHPLHIRCGPLPPFLIHLDITYISIWYGIYFHMFNISTCLFSFSHGNISSLRVKILFCSLLHGSWLDKYLLNEWI